MRGRLTLPGLEQAVAEGSIDTVVAAQTDMQGRLMGKRFQAEFFLESAHRGTHGCNYLIATDYEMETVPGFKAASWAAGYGDYVMRPDLSTLRLTPWLEGTALVLCDVLDHHGHAEVPHSPRAVLKRQIARLAERGLAPMMASELEFFLFTDSYAELHAAGYRGMKPFSPYNEDYHVFQTTKEEAVMRAIRTGLQGAGIPVESSKGEASAGQEEINVSYADALAAADAHVVTKNAVKEIAWAKGRAVTFMAKYAQDAAGSSCHIHQSLRREDGSAAFHDAGAPHGMSATMRSYLAGLLAHAAETTCFLAPNINSYKRFVAGTFAPTKTVWSTDNRTAGFRLCGAELEGGARRVPDRRGGPQPLPRLRGPARRRHRRHRRRPRARRRVPWRRLHRRPPARDPDHAARGDRGAPALEDAARRPRRRRRRSLRPRRSMGAGRVRPPRDRLGAGPRLRTGLTRRPGGVSREQRYSLYRAARPRPRWAISARLRART